MASRSGKKVDLDADLLAAAHAATSEASNGDSDVVNRALRLYVGRSAIATAQSMSELSEEEALRIVYEELHAMRRERHVA
jgi:Arc/MetJ family transcription regulator